MKIPEIFFYPDKKQLLYLPFWGAIFEENIEVQD